MLYVVRKDTSNPILGDDKSSREQLLQNAINQGFTIEQVEILTQAEYDARKALEPQPEPQSSEFELLRLEMARSNAEMFEMMVTLMMGGAE